ncbi:MAG TPA: hypothetical protein ENK35_06795 [Candidatus Tenderia sp.]|nr:hypothetical protein [Candidatus Tenderia sp.]
MNVKVWLGAMLLCLATSVTSIGYAADKRALVADLVFELGYGRAIHHFKDYVLRGEDDYRLQARKYFVSAREKVAALRQVKNLTEKEIAALDDLDGVIQSYLGALSTIQSAYRHSRGLVQVLTTTDDRVHIDDASAIDAIAVLRQGHRWHRVEKLVFVLGYGSAIYNFKNYLIRRDEQYRKWADAQFEEALQLVAEIRWRERKNPPKVKALENIKSVLEAYRAALPLMARTLKPSMETSSNIVVNIAVRGADRALKVDDKPAFDGIALLLGR